MMRTPEEKSALRRQHLIQYLQIFLAAGLMWAAFPDPDLWFLSIPALALLIAATDCVGTGRGAWYAVLWTMVFFVPHISWMNIATNGTYMAWFALCLLQAFFMMFWGAFFAASRTWPWARTILGEAVVAATLWVGIEQLRSRVPFGGFPWAKIAYAQVDSPLIVFAPIGGEVLVTWIAVALAVVLRIAFRLGKEATLSPWTRLALLGGFAAALVAPMMVRLPTNQENGSIEVAAIQGNVAIPMEDTFAIEGRVTDNHLQETLRMLESGESPDLIIWGETAVDSDPATSPMTAAMIEQASKAAGVPIVAGYQEYVDDVRYNWMAVWDPKTGLQEEKYAKQHPVPWGEFVPWRQFSEALATEVARVSVDMVAADNPGYLEVTLVDGRVVPIAIGICFEAGDEPIAAEGIRLGGELIVIPTNNAQFRTSAESTQQLQMVRFRAAEFSRSALQVSTNGVSAVIRPDGGVHYQTGKQEAAHIVADVPLRTSLTPAARISEGLALAMIGITGVFGLFAIGASIIRRRRNQNV